MCAVVDYVVKRLCVCVCAGVSVCVQRWERLVSYVNVNGIGCGCVQKNDAVS